MIIFVWLMVYSHLKAELSGALVTCGILCVKPATELTRGELLVNSLNFQVIYTQ